MATLGDGKHRALQSGERSFFGVRSDMPGLLQGCRITSLQEMKLVVPLLFLRELLEKAPYHWVGNV